MKTVFKMKKYSFALSVLDIFLKHFLQKIKLRVRHVVF